MPFLDNNNTFELQGDGELVALNDTYDDDEDEDGYEIEPGDSRSLSPPSSPGGGHNLPATATKKVIYFVRHAEAVHNVKEREAIAAAIAAGYFTKAETEAARRAVLNSDPSLRDAPLSEGGISQVRGAGKRLSELFGNDDRDGGGAGGGGVFRRPDTVLVSPLRRTLMTATEMFLHLDPPPKFMAVEALREKRTGMACDERSSVAELREQFPHVDFGDVERGTIPAVPEGEDNAAVRARGARYLDRELCRVEGDHVAVVSHKGWLREMRGTFKSRIDCGRLRADFDLESWDTKLYGNSEVRVAALRWQDGEVSSVVSRSIDNAIVLNSAAGMVSDGFEFALGPPSSGFSMFLAQRTTKVHFISVSEGKHNQFLRRLTRNVAAEGGGEDAVRDATEKAEASLLREEGRAASDHALFDARLTRRGMKQAAALRATLSTRPSGGRPFTAFELVVCSPLTRSCEAASIVFGHTPGTFGGSEVPPPRVVVLEECRERFGKYACDGRRRGSELSAEFPGFDFSEVESDGDVFHGDERETLVEVQDRAMRLLQWLNDRPERCIAVVSHSEILQHVFGQFGDTLHKEDRTSIQRATSNCELRSVVLCSHCPTERKDAPASTIRISSCNTLSSMISNVSD